jgi:cytosine/adenosine deaminase-related metal-dependent hydrolase
VDVLSADWVLPIAGEPIADGAVAVQDGRIAAVGMRKEFAEGRHFPGAAIMPGFVNAHSHLEYTVYAGFGDGLAFVPWIAMHVERKDRIGWAEMLDIARLGAAECLASAITTVADASFSGAAAVACAEIGLNAVVHLETFGSDPEVVLQRFQERRARVADVSSDHVRIGVSPHAPYTVSAAGYGACASLGLPIATHLNESEAELEWLLHGTGTLEAFRELIVPPAGQSGIRMLATNGLLGPRVSAAHCVVVDEEEIALLAEHEVGVVHCPRSNALLGCGIAPVRQLLEAGVRLGIGTDSPASTPSFDMFEELRTAVYLARARARRPDALPAREALALATLGSARALGLESELGSLEPGKRADLAVVSLDGSPFLPWEEPEVAVVLGGSPARVLLTMVEGEVPYEPGTFRWHELRQRGTEARAKLLAL